MKKKFTNTPLVDEYLKSLQPMQEAETDAFFYTRLKAKMEKDEERSWSLPFRPAWVISLLAVFLFINAFVVSQQIKSSEKINTEAGTLQNFASSYNLSVSTPY